MSATPQFVQQTAVLLVAAGALTVSTSSAEAQEIPDIFADSDTVYYAIADDTSGLLAGYEIWAGFIYADEHTDIGPDSFVFQSTNIFAGDGVGIVLIDNGITQEATYITGGDMTAFHDFPVDDWVSTYVTGGFFQSYGTINYLDFELFGPGGETFTTLPGEDLTLDHMFNETALGNYTGFELSGRIGGQDINAEISVVYLPAPGTVALLGLGGLATGRRRR